MLKKKQNPPYYEYEDRVKIYRGVMTQNGTAAPNVTVLINTFDNEIIWTRDSAGLYIGSGNQYNDARTIVLMGQTSGEYIVEAHSSFDIIVVGTYLNGVRADGGIPVQVGIEIIEYPSN